MSLSVGHLRVVLTPWLLQAAFCFMSLCIGLCCSYCLSCLSLFSAWEMPGFLHKAQSPPYHVFISLCIHTFTHSAMSLEPLMCLSPTPTPAPRLSLFLSVCLRLSPSLFVPFPLLFHSGMGRLDFLNDLVNQSVHSTQGPIRFQVTFKGVIMLRCACL